jgi:hypothetical protein
MYTLIFAFLDSRRVDKNSELNGCKHSSNLVCFKFFVIAVLNCYSHFGHSNTVTLSDHLFATFLLCLYVRSSLNDDVSVEWSEYTEFETTLEEGVVTQFRYSWPFVWRN